MLFVSGAIERAGRTEPVTFQSKHPSGVKDGEWILSAQSFRMQQSWSADSSDEIRAGDVIVRKITRRSNGSTSMMFPDIPIESLDGVRIYRDAPVLEDKTQRGESTSTRIDVLKYQFERGGEFQLADVNSDWWDYDKETLSTESIPGLSVTVREPEAAPGDVTSTGESDSGILWLAASVIGGGLILGILLAWSYRSARVRSSEQREAIQVVAACRRNDARAAYTALLRWHRAANADEPLPERLNRQKELLADSLYGETPPSDSWNGQEMLRVFRDVRKRWNTASRNLRSAPSLPNLNPVGSEIPPLPEH